jgi:phosphoglycolate phosphatase
MGLDTEIDWRNYDTFIFDLDGTLVDSLDQIERSLNTTRLSYGYKKTPEGQVFSNLGLPLRHLFSDLDMPQDQQDEFVAFFRNELTKQISISNQLYPNVSDLVFLIRDQDIKIAIATSKPTHLAKMVIENSEINGMINFIQGTDYFPAKPDPEVIRRCISSLKSKSAIMVGDRKEDVLAASAAGIPAIGIAQSAHSENMLIASGAKLTFERIDLLYESIKTSFGMGWS